MIQFDELKEIDKGSGFTISELSGGSVHHKQLSYLKNGAMVAFFDGVDVALDFIAKNMDKPKKDGSSADRGSSSFNTYDTYEEALDVFRHKPETVAKFDQAELHIKDTHESGTEVDYDVTGDYIDMGRYMEGVPESVGTMHGGKSRNRRVNITVQLNQGSWVSESDINHRSERLLRLVDALEHGGVRTMVTAVDSSICGHTEIILKHHADTLTIPDIAVVTQADFKRRIIFRINEYSKTWDYGYGSPTSYRDAITPEKLQGELNDEVNIFITGGLQDTEEIDRLFDQMERLVVWELSKPIPEVSAIKLSVDGIYFEANGARGESEIQREGKEVINGS
jgi:hypothetical protein